MRHVAQTEPLRERDHAARQSAAVGTYVCRPPGPVASRSCLPAPDMVRFCEMGQTKFYPELRRDGQGGIEMGLYLLPVGLCQRFLPDEILQGPVLAFRRF